jgi:large subunit ribosomal protein L29
MMMEDIKSLDVKWIDALVGVLRKELFEMRMEKASAGIDKPHRKKVIKRDIARLLTAKNAKDA